MKSHGDRRRGYPQSRHHQRGQSMIEFALVFPLLFLFVVEVVNVGSYLVAAVTVANAARAAAEYASIGSALPGWPVSPSDADVGAMVQADALSLPNRDTLQVRVSHVRNGVLIANCVVGVCSGMPAVPSEPDDVSGRSFQFYVLVAVDVTYSFTPPIPLWRVAANSRPFSYLPSQIHRQGVMRMLQ